MNTPSNTPVEPDFGPSLPEILRVWLPKRARWQQALLALAVLGLLVLIGTAFFKAEAANNQYVQTNAASERAGLDPLPFNFDYSNKLKVSQPKGSYVRLERTRNGVLVAQMTISPIEIGSEQGQPAGWLPLKAIELERRAAQEYPGYRLQFEGRSRVNFAEGYQFAFNARLRQPGEQDRQLFGRTVIITEPYKYDDPAVPYPAGEQPERGLLVQMLSTTLDTKALAQDIGDTGILKQPFRTLRFGT